LASFADTHLVVWALIASQGAARATMPALMYLLPPARGDGLSFNAGHPPGESVAAAAILGVLILAFCLHPGRGAVALILLCVAVAVTAWLSMRQIEGQTGDVLGAAEQVSEIVILLVALG
jgi:adenosylcobinamide-GDP ribazoletransferase